MPAATVESWIAAALCGRRRPAIWASARSSATTIRHIELLTKLCGKFGSDSDNERAVAARLANDLVYKLDLRWGDVLALPTTNDAANDTPDESDPGFWASIIRQCQNRPELLSRREHGFLAAVARWVARNRLPSPRQQTWILDIARRASP
jgi:hypothetical protein